MALTQGSDQRSADGPDAGVHTRGRARVPARTLRPDRWWLNPLATFVVFCGVRRLRDGPRLHGLALLRDAVPLAVLLALPRRLRARAPPTSASRSQWWPFSAALIILIFPLGFRMTCYYYRKAYYRSFWLSPPACAVAEPHSAYSGETRLPLILNNLHRYFWYAALVVGAILTFDTVLTFRNEDGEWGHMGLGSLVFLANIALIWLYTLSCHSCRHAVGGRLRHFSKHPVRYRMWTWVSRLNARHALFAWLSLFSVAFADLYVLLLSTGTITDPRFF